MSKKNNNQEKEQYDFREQAAWRVFRVMAEFIDGSQFLKDLKKEVTFFGSARLKPNSKYYKEATKLGKLLGKAGYTVITGGGPGIMEAGNRGAYEAGAPSIGLNIQLPFEQLTNPYVKRGIGFHYFFTRKFMLSASAQAYVYFPGGYGTMDEFFEIITLIQTKKMDRLPVICVGKEYWEPLHKFLDTQLAKKFKTINTEDCKIYKIVDNANQAFNIIKKSKERKYF